MKQLRQLIRKYLIESIKLDIEPGDVILTGRFKNKRTVVKSIGKDQYGHPTINGKSILKFKIEKQLPKKKWSAKSREELNEIYDIKDDPEHKERIELFGWDENEVYNIFDNQDSVEASDRRAWGLQSPNEQRKEAEFLKQYQAKIEPQFRNKFRTGEYAIIHSIEYDGWASKKTIFDVVQWYEEYGSQNRNQLSTLAYPTSIQNVQRVKPGINSRSIPYSFGVVLKGYPVFVSSYDEMTQTLSGVSNKQKQHQKGSGIAKRVSPELNQGIYTEEQFKKLGVAEELILDNWTVIGFYYDTEKWAVLPMKQKLHVLAKAEEFNLPGVYIFKNGSYNNLLTKQMFADYY